MRKLIGARACAAIYTALAPAGAYAQNAQIAATARDEIVIRGRRENIEVPSTVEIVTAETLADTVNVINAEDALKYVPNVLIRKRHIGDTQAPMTTRTSGVGASARSLIFADGVLLSALIGNNNSSASPRWSMVAPETISHIELLYGPFAAEYAGNSIGAVVNIATRMPEQFEASLRVQAVWQSFSQYSTSDTYPAQEYSAFIGDQTGRLSWWLSVNHLNSYSQPLGYVTVARPAAISTNGVLVVGAYADMNRANAPIQVIGSGGLEHQIQDNISAKFAYEIADGWRATYGIGYFRHDNNAHAESYLKDASSAPVYAGSVNSLGYNLAVPASAFSNNIYQSDESHWMHSLSLKSDEMEPWSFALVGSLYDYATGTQRIPSIALPAATSGGPGSITKMNGTGWYTLDGSAQWRANDTQTLRFGVHHDRYRLENGRINLSDWLLGNTGPTATVASGKTDTTAIWAQDAWRFHPDFKLTLGGRYEHWRAHHGFNFSATPALSVNQPSLDAWRFSPKASLEWKPGSDWTATASVGVAFRFPTVTELYQAVTTGATLTVPNPNLKPERALSEEISLERAFTKGRMRFSLFQENIRNALLSQSAPLVSGSTTLFNYVQNVAETRARGAEVVVEADDVLVRGMQVSASATYTDPIILSDPVFPAAIGKQVPQVPRFRATGVLTYRPDEHWAFTLAGRYSDRVYGTIDNSDSVTHTYQGFDGFFVMDVRVRYELDRHWSAAVGIDNVNDAGYFLFHPFPQRTVSAEVKYSY